MQFAVRRSARYVLGFQRAQCDLASTAQEALKGSPRRRFKERYSDNRHMFVLVLRRRNGAPAFEKLFSGRCQLHEVYDDGIPEAAPFTSESDQPQVVDRHMHVVASVNVEFLSQAAQHGVVWSPVARRIPLFLE